MNRLKRFEGDLNDWSTTFNSVGDYLMDVYSRLMFSTEGAYLGQRWANLSPGYEVQKAKKYPGRGILEASGKLKGGFRKQVGPQSLEIKNVITYAHWHQDGSPGGMIKQRPLIGMSDQVEGKIVNFFIDGVTGKIRKAFS